MTTEENKILIVEDDKSLSRALMDKFLMEGFKVLVASDGIEGFEKALTEKPDVLLLDILMPALDGMTMAAKLRESGEWGKGAKIIFLTNVEPDTKTISKINECSPAFYLVKSDWQVHQIVEKVKECL